MDDYDMVKWAFGGVFFIGVFFGMAIGAALVLWQSILSVSQDIFED